MRLVRVIGFAAVYVLVVACSGMKDSWFATGVHPEEALEMKAAIRRVTVSPVTYWSRSYADPPNEVMVGTEDGKFYRAVKVRGKWYFTEVVILATSPGPSNQSMQPTADRPYAQS